MKKGIVSAVLIGTALNVAMMAGAGEAVGSWVKEVTANGGQIAATLQLELGTQPSSAPAETTAPTAQAPIMMQVEVSPVPMPSVSVESEEPEKKSTEIVAATMRADAEVRNDTGFTLNLEELAAESLSLHLEKDMPQILIIHTHSSEAYTPDDFDQYEASDVSRTEDKTQNVIRVGDVLTEELESYGLCVIHDREIYDYPSYTGSYNRSGAAIEQYLEDHPSIAVVIDLHRDAIGSGDVVYKTKAELSGQSCAQVMMLIGTGENGLPHPNWRENLKLALYLQNAVDARYPTLARPIALKKERYNQQLTTGSMILEVGSSGNTLAEALLAVKLFGQAVGPALAELADAQV